MEITDLMEYANLTELYGKKLGVKFTIEEADGLPAK